jgi:hypothetical protein
MTTNHSVPIAILTYKKKESDSFLGILLAKYAVIDKVVTGICVVYPYEIAL